MARTVVCEGAKAPYTILREGRLGNDIFACGKNDIGLWPTILPLRGNDIHACGMNGGSWI